MRAIGSADQVTVIFVNVVVLSMYHDGMSDGTQRATEPGRVAHCIGMSRTISAKGKLTNP